MTTPDTPDTPDTVLSAERLHVGSEWVQSGYLRLRRRIVTETRTVEVVVRREELVVEGRDLTTGAVGESYAGARLDGTAVSVPERGNVEPLVILLREEVPEVVVRPRVYERVTAELRMVTGMAVVTDTARHEQAAFEVRSQDR